MFIYMTCIFIQPYDMDINSMTIIWTNFTVFNGYMIL